MKNVIALILSVALASACVETTPVRRASRDALADYDATEHAHLSENYFLARTHVMTCPYVTESGAIVEMPAYGFEWFCRAFAMDSH
jgi:hypothetical protein